MKLLLTANGITNDAIKNELERLLGKPFEEARCALVPTAIHAERGDKRWKLASASELMAMNWQQLEIIDIAISSKEDFASVIADSDMVMFGGGNPQYLYSKIVEKFSPDEFRQLMKDKVWVGASAGSMILSPNIYLDRAWEFYGEQPPELPNDGLGWVDFYTLPHFDGSEFATGLCKNSGVHVYALGDGNALSLNSCGSKPSIIEEPRWEVFGRTKENRRIIFIGGASAVGKTTIAKKLGKHLGLPWFSADYIHDIALTMQDSKDSPVTVGIRETSAEEFYEKHSIQEVVESEVAISHETWRGIQALIDSGFEGIIEGVALLPGLISTLEAEADVQAIFLTNEDEDAILQVAREQGIWDLPHLYSDETKQKEVEFVLAYNKLLKEEAAKYNYPTVAVERTEADLEKVLELLNN